MLAEKASDLKQGPRAILTQVGSPGGLVSEIKGGIVRPKVVPFAPGRQSPRPQAATASESAMLGTTTIGKCSGGFPCGADGTGSDSRAADLRYLEGSKSRAGAARDAGMSAFWGDSPWS